ncbi:hypothetical protein JQ633_20025 [Bradyrhizobium tropiciagri]|uniref:hypothetical protein n=1 Tax=Bradyrhizobium tropiciagri TaxID=312253 RepID=UPI001BAB2FBB|nr:hypothetical protein [Bradyrhizobium tropiciagri]MBR0872661.1 hypothetical protein [Bradyrhizobium tropiciagri]
MKRAFAIAAPLAVLVSAVILTAPQVQAGELRPTIPPELVTLYPLPPPAIPYRCSTGPVTNAYDGALYNAPPAVYRGFAYRPYYRYTAYRVVPQTYVCAE